MKHNIGLPNSDLLGRKTTHLHTSSDIGADSYYGSNQKYGSLPPSMRKRNGDMYTNTSKLSAPISNSFKVNRDKADFELNQEEMSGEDSLHINIFVQVPTTCLGLPNDDYTCISL